MLACFSLAKETTIVQDAGVAAGPGAGYAAAASPGRRVLGIEAVVVNRATFVRAGALSDRPISGAELVRGNQNSGLAITVHRPRSHLCDNLIDVSMATIRMLKRRSAFSPMPPIEGGSKPHNHFVEYDSH